MIDILDENNMAPIFDSKSYTYKLDSSQYTYSTQGSNTFNFPESPRIYIMDHDHLKENANVTITASCETATGKNCTQFLKVDLSLVNDYHESNAGNSKNVQGNDCIQCSQDQHRVAGKFFI